MAFLCETIRPNSDAANPKRSGPYCVYTRLMIDTTGRAEYTGSMLGRQKRNPGKDSIGSPLFCFEKRIREEITMNSACNFPRGISVVFVLMLLVTAGCHKLSVPIVGGHGTPLPIVPRAPTKRLTAKVNPSLLPLGAHAQFPAYDGDPFFVSLPVRQVNAVTATDVRDQVIVPVLKGVGFERGMNGLAMPPTNGLNQPVGNFKGLAQAVAYEYANHRQLFRPETQEMLDVFLGKIPPSADLNKGIELGEGMNFAQFVAGIERLEIQFPFQQVEGNVPIEHTLLIASRWQEQGITSVWGALFNDYSIANTRRLTASDATRLAARALSTIRGIRKVSMCQPLPRPEITAEKNVPRTSE